MDDRDVYEISFNLGPAEKEIDALLARLSSLESRIIKTFQIIETVTVGSVNKATAELGRLSGAIEKSLDDIQKKAGSRKKPIVIVEQKDVQQAKKNLADMGDAVTELAKKVDDQATEIAGDIQRAFQPPPTLVTDTQVFLPTTATEINPATRLSPTQAGYPAAVYRSDLNTQALPGSEAAAPVPIAPALAQNEAALKEEAKQAAIAERALVRLLAAELRVAAGADQVTKEYIDAAAATAKNADAYIDQVNAIAKVGTAQERLTRDQVEYAQTVARTKNEINNLNKQLQEQAAAYNNAKNRLQENIAVQQGVQGAGGKPMADAGAATRESLEAFEAEKDIRDELIEKIDAQVAKLRFLNDEREKGAAAAQRQAEIEKAAEDAKLAIGQDVAARRVAQLRQEQAAQALLNKQREQAAAQFVRIAKSMGTESTALNALGQKYGIFSVNLKRTADASNAVEKEFHDIIRASPQLSHAFDQLIDQVGEFQVKADPSTFRSAQGFFLDPNDVRQLGFAFQRFGVTGVAAFGEIYAAIGPVGLAIGLVTVAGVTLIKTLVAIGKAGVQAFKDILAASIELASKRQTLGEGFEAYLQDAEAAKAALEEVDRISRDLGVDVSPIAQSFLPSVKSIEELELLARLGQSLALSKPGKQIEDATVAIREFLAGDITSLRKQFEVPGYVLDEAKKISETTGSAIEGLRHISEFLERTGRSAEALSDTFAVSKTRVQEFLNTLGRDLGAPVVDTLESALNDILATVTDKESVLRSFAYGIGSTVSDVLEGILEAVKVLIDSIKDEEVASILGDIYRVGAALNLLLDQLTINAGEAGGAIDALTFYIEYLIISVTAVVSVFSLVIDGIRVVGGALKLLNPQVFNSGEAWAELARNAEKYREQIKGVGDVLTAGVNLIAEPRGNVPEDFAARVQEYVDALGNADTANLDDILASQFQGGDDSVNELKEAVEKYLKEIADLRQDVINKNLDLAVKLSDTLLDFLEDNARKRLEIARKNRDDLIDLEEEYERKVRDANQDLADSLEDVDIEAGRQRLRQAREFADKRVEIEEDYQRKVAEIRRKYAFDLQEAARQNDAVAYLRLLRQREFDLNEARIDRDEALGDVDTDEGKKNDEAAQKRREDEEDARRSNKRKLRDLQTWLDDQEAEIKKNYKRELEAQTIQEEEKRKDIIKNYQRDLRDLRLHYEQRLEELQKGLAEEYDIVGQWQQRMLDQQREFVTQWFGITNGTIGKNTPGVAGGRGPGDQPVQPGRSGGATPAGGGHNKEWYEDGIVSLARRLGYNEYVINGIQRQFANMTMAQLIAMYNRLVSLYANQTNNQTGAPSRDSGGHVQANQSVIVGRNGMPELFTPGSSGYITPVSQLYRQPLPAAAQSYAYDQRRMNVDLSLLDTAMLDRSIAELVKLRIREVMEEAFV